MKYVLLTFEPLIDSVAPLFTTCYMPSITIIPPLM